MRITNNAQSQITSISAGQFFIFVSFLGWVKLSPLGTSTTTALLYQPLMMDDDGCGAVGGMTGRGNWSTRRKTCHSAALSTTNPAWPDPNSNPDRRSRKPATNGLSYGTSHLQANSSRASSVLGVLTSSQSWKFWHLELLDFDLRSFLVSIPIAQYLSSQPHRSHKLSR
jgi:hypothetical protein